MVSTRTFVSFWVFLALVAQLVPNSAEAQELKLSLRSRAGDGKKFTAKTVNETWNPKQSAVIVCDMWDSHHCPNAVKRVVEMAPRMNEFLDTLRGKGVFIIHAPSSCMPAYKDHPARLRAKNVSRSKNLPKDIGRWCYKIPAEGKAPYPIDQSDGGCDCTTAQQAAWDVQLKAMGRNPKAPWKSQIDLLKIRDEDAISDSGEEIWSMLERRKINNVMLVGVHTNMCVLGRPFGLRQLAKNGKHVVLVRDLTDTMYNPKRRPFVSHFRGTQLIVEYIEKVVCPTITSDQVLGGSVFRFKGDVKK